MAKKTLSANALLEELVKGSTLSIADNDNGLLPATIRIRPTTEKQKVLIITGVNATGKSFVRRILGTYARKQEVEEVMHLSMEKRTEGGMVSAMMFGSESDRSTGSITAHSIVMGTKTSQGREKPHLLFWDEPDLGLADEYLEDAAEQIVAHSQANNECVLIGINSHRKTLIGLILKKLGAKEPHHLHMGERNGPTLNEWLNRAPQSLKLEDIAERNITTFRKICARMRENESKRNRKK